MNKKYTSKASQTDWERIAVMQDEDIDLSEIPEITAAQLARAHLRVGGKPVPKGKVCVNVILDADVWEDVKAQSREYDYHTLINDALKAKIHHGA